MDEYIEKAKELFYLMSKMVIKSLPREKILYLLEGLNIDYISLVTNITHKKSMPSMDKVLP